MGLRIRQFRRQLGLASAFGLCVMLSGAVVGNGNSASGGFDLEPSAREFRFARLQYNGNFMDGSFRGRGSWSTDAFDAEYHLLMGIRRLTRIDAIDSQRVSSVNDCQPLNATRETFVVCTPTDEGLFDFPFLYAVEVGRWYLDDVEAGALREYLERGGFLMVDDFHGLEQWYGFMESLQRIFPDRDVVEIPDDHEVFHVLYDLDQKVQIPGISALMSGRTWEQSDDPDPHWRGVFDDDGRLMVAINYNMDLGDAWEHADDPGYEQPLTALAYRFAISYVLYAMTH
jgi:hypothetical protein